MDIPHYPGSSEESPGGIDPRQLAERISNSLQQVERFASNLGKTDNLLNLASIFSSAALTAITGWTAMAGPIFGTSVDAWRLTCLIAALLGFLATLFMGVSQQLRLGEQVARAHECIGRLRSLDFSLISQSLSLQEVWKEYAEILRNYPREFR